MEDTEEIEVLVEAQARPVLLRLVLEVFFFLKLFSCLGELILG